MKKALNISLSGTPFTIEEDAYAKLDVYLQSVRAHFSATPDKDDIVSDIESRITEQFIEFKKQIITLYEVNAVIASMGKVEDFDDAQDAKEIPKTEYQPGKKFYRDTDDVIISGVASGLAAYFGIEALWMRIIFVLLAFGTGFGILLYVILWIITPAAKTASEKLEMKGSPVNLTTISENVREKVEEVKVRHEGTFRTIVHKILSLVKSIVKGIFPIIRITVGLFITVFSFFGILALSFAAPTLILHGGTFFTPLPLYDVVGLALFYTLVIAGYLALIIPAILICLVGISLIRNKKVYGKNRTLPLFIIWCAAVIIASVGAFTAAERVGNYADDTGIFEQSTRVVPITGDIETLVVSRGLHVIVEQGDAKEIEIKAPPYLMEYVEITEKNGVLELNLKNTKRACWFCDKSNTDITVTLPSLTTLEAHEGARVEATINTSEFKVLAQEGACVELVGTMGTTTLTATIGARIEAQDAMITAATADAREGARITIDKETNLTETEKDGGRVDQE